jgi:uncharacterized membrane protein YkvA (DUF1232 family)
MAEIANFVRRGATRVTPNILKNILSHVAMLKLEFTQVDDPKFPHLVDQLEFLVDFVEDFADGQLPDTPYAAAAHAAFAICYAHQKMDLIPDFVEGLGHADDSSIVRAVLIEFEPVFQVYAIDRDLDWAKITVDK